MHAPGYPKARSIETPARVLGVGDKQNVVELILEKLPLELRGQVATILRGALEDEERRTRHPSPVPRLGD
jgi:hypothetical protein